MRAASGSLALLAVSLSASPAWAGPPGGIDALSPHTVKSGPALASDIVFSSTVVGAIGLGLGAGMSHGDWGGLTATSGTLVVTAGLTEITKVLAGRRRPYTWDPTHAAAGVQDYCRGTAPVKSDDCKSFFSGHTAITAASSFSAVRSMQLSGRLSSKQDMALAYASASLLTVGAGSLRVAAGKHYVTDIAVGALVGVGLGLLGPSLTY